MFHHLLLKVLCLALTYLGYQSAKTLPNTSKYVVGLVCVGLGICLYETLCLIDATLHVVDKIANYI